MIVPRSFTSHGINFNEKSDAGNLQSRSRSRSQTRSRSTSPFHLPVTRPNPFAVDNGQRSDPVRIPLRRSKELDHVSASPTNVAVRTNVVEPKAILRARHGSVQEILSSTAIPSRKKARGRPSQRLPKGDHVADFSKLMQQDVKSKDGSLSRSFSGSYMDALFGNIDGLVEGEMIVDSEGLDESILVTRSISSESLASLASPEDYGSSGIGSQRSSFGRSYETRRLRQQANSQDCATDHPLMPTGTDELIEEPTSPTSHPSPTSKIEKKARSFKSSLTASLKAIRSAAQSVSSRATSFAIPDSQDYLARSFFDIQPWLTDDKRPPPANSLPSPQLRRYLNPYSANSPPDSPTQLHFWQDERHPNSSSQAKKTKSKSRRKALRNGTTSPGSANNLPSVVQLSTCLPPSVRTANASSPPIWLNADGTPSNKQTANPLLQDPDSVLENVTNQPRHREPRENRDFLRVFVCEMEMRRHGKLSDDIGTGRARLWLPPVSNDFRGAAQPTASSGEDSTSSGLNAEASSVHRNGNPKRGQERWQSWTADDL